MPEIVLDYEADFTAYNTTSIVGGEVVTWLDVTSSLATYYNPQNPIGPPWDDPPPGAATLAHSLTEGDFEAVQVEFEWLAPGWHWTSSVLVALSEAPLVYLPPELQVLAVPQSEDHWRVYLQAASTQQSVLLGPTEGLPADTLYRLRLWRDDNSAVLQIQRYDQVQGWVDVDQDSVTTSWSSAVYLTAGARDHDWGMLQTGEWPLKLHQMTLTYTSQQPEPPPPPPPPPPPIVIQPNPGTPGTVVPPPGVVNPPPGLSGGQRPYVWQPGSSYA